MCMPWTKGKEGDRDLFLLWLPFFFSLESRLEMKEKVVVTGCSDVVM